MRPATAAPRDSPAPRAIRASRTACSVRPIAPATRIGGVPARPPPRQRCAAPARRGRLADRELRGVHADREPARAGVQVVARQRPLPPRIELPPGVSASGCAGMTQPARSRSSRPAGQSCQCRAIRTARPAPRTSSALPSARPPRGHPIRHPIHHPPAAARGGSRSAAKARAALDSSAVGASVAAERPAAARRRSPKRLGEPADRDASPAPSTFKMGQARSAWRSARSVQALASPCQITLAWPIAERHRRAGRSTFVATSCSTP